MPASTEQKVDFLLKKIGYSASKTGGVEGTSGTVDGTKKKPTEEAIPSPLIIPSTSIWADSSLIPATPPGSDTFPVKVYATASAFRLTVDSSVSESRSFIARSTYGNQSSSIDGNWIDSQFGADYAVRVFKGDPNSGGVELPQAGATGNDTWFFDYSSGILNFNGTDNHASLGVTDTNIYILGYRYTGGVGAKPPIGIGTFDSLNVTGIATFHKDVEFIGAGNAGIKSAYWDQSASSLKFLDNVKAQFGDSQDLSIYHFSGGQGSNYISGANSKPIAITAQKVELLNQGHTSYFFKADADGTILYNNGAHKLVTTGYGVTVTGLESVGISTFNGAVIINDKLTINPDDASTTWQRELDTIHQIRDDIYLESTLNVGDKAGFDFTPLGITTFSYSGTTLTVGVTTTHALAAGKNILIKDSASGFSEAFNTIAGTTGTTVKVTRGSDPSSSLSIANTKVTVYTPTDPRGCVNVAKDYAKFNENSFNPILRGFVGIATTSAAAPSTEVFKIELKKDASAADHVATLLHSTREFGAGQRIALTIDDGNSYPDGKNLVLTQNGVKITADDSAFTDSDELLEVEGNAKIDGNLNVTGISTFQDDVTFQTANTNNLVLDKSDNSLKFGDSVRAKFGASTDMEIYHTTASGGTNFIKSTANLTLQSNVIVLEDQSGNDSIRIDAGGAVKIYHPGSTEKLRTTSTGISITGQLDVGNIGISTGLIKGPATMYIDPATVGDNTGLLVVKGNLQVDGTQTTVNSSTMTVTDKNIEIAKGAANDAAADGAGITVDSGDGDKTWNWVDATDSWTSSEHIRIPDGKVFGFATDTNTYIGRPAADTIAFTHGGSEKVRIMSGGAIGINTTTGTNNVSIGGAEGLGVKFHNFTSGNMTYITVQPGDNLASNIGGTGYFTWHTGGNEKVRFANNGTVGIGTILPTSNLHVANYSGDATIEIESGNSDSSILRFGDVDNNDVGQIEYDHSDNSIRISNSNTQERVRINSSGQVAIGMTNNTGSNTKLVVGTGSTTADAVAVINTNDQDVDVIRLSNFDGSTTTNKLEVHFDSSGHAGFDVGIPATTPVFEIRNTSGGGGRFRLSNDGKLLLNTTTAGYSTADDLTIATSGSTGITLRSGTSSEGTLYFADGTGGTAQYSGIIAYNHGDNSMRFATNDGTEKLRIKSTGYVGIGTVDPQALLHVYDDAAAVYNKIESTHSAAALELRQVNRYGTLNYYYQGTHKWIIGQVNQEDDISIFQPTGVAAGENSYRVVVKASGNIGIHSSSPTTTLDVAGTTKTKQLNVTGISTFDGVVSIADSIVHTGNTNTSIRFPSNDKVSMEIAGTKGFELNSDQLWIRGAVKVGDYVAHRNTDSLGIKFAYGGHGNINTRVGLGAEDNGTSTNHQTFNVYRQGSAVERVNIDNSGNLNAKLGFTVAGVSTFTGTVNANGDLDVDGHTELDNVNISGMTTVSDHILPDTNGTDVDLGSSTKHFRRLYASNIVTVPGDPGGPGFAGSNLTANNLSVIGFSTFTKSIDANSDFTVAGVSTFSDNVIIAEQKELRLEPSGAFKIYRGAGGGGATNFVKSTFGSISVEAANAFIAKVNNNEDAIAAYANDRVDLYHNNQIRLTTKSSGVGIAGSLTVSDDLHVSGISTFGGNLLVDSNSAQINLKAGTSGQTGAINWTFNSTGTPYSSISLPFNTRITDGFIIDGDNYNVSVKTDGFVKLYSGGNLRLNTNSEGIYVTGKSNISGDLVVGAGGTTITTTVGAAASVGIGTANPAYMLDVEGAINSSTDVKINGTSVLTSALDEAVAMAIALG